jgi:hypothetical protein
MGEVFYVLRELFYCSYLITSTRKPLEMRLSVRVSFSYLIKKITCPLRNIDRTIVIRVSRDLDPDLEGYK